MRRNFISAILVLLILLFTKCEYNDNKIIIVNKSKQSIYYLAYPDTVVQLTSVENFAQIPYRKINVNDSTHPLFARQNEGGVVNKINNDCKDSTLKVFLFPVDTVTKYGWRKVLDLHKYNRYDYTVSALDSLKWRIVYRD